MDSKKLLYFLSVVESGSFNKAAKKLEISQPALSTSMDRLEIDIGQRLLDRSPTGVLPTQAGEVLLAHARLIRDELALAKNRLMVVPPKNEDSLVFGTLPSLATNVIPKAVCEWRTNHPKSTLRIVEKIQFELLLSLMRGEVEFIIAQTEYFGYLDGLMQRVLFRDKLHVIARPDHPAHSIKNLTWKELAKFPWIIQMIGRQRTLFEKLLEANSVEWPEQLTECGSVNCIKELVASSNSLCMLPESAISADVQNHRIKAIDISEPMLHRDIAVLYRERFPPSDAGRALLVHVTEIGTHGNFLNYE
jgi:DNA-binding transcriptional LysR family regulator